jgi:purine-cytosine permease-like protein
VFVPLFGVFLADYYVTHRGRYGDARPSEGVRVAALVPWALGFVSFHLFAAVGPSGWLSVVGEAFGTIGLEHPLFGGTVPGSVVAFAVAFGVAMLLSRSRRESAAAEPRP